MPLVSASILPHSPILIPEIGKANHSLLTQTDEAYAKIAEKLKQIQPDTIVIISPHGLVQEEYFTANAFPDPVEDLSSFGYLGQQQKFISDLALLDQIRQTSSSKLQTLSHNLLDYSTTIPLKLLAGENIKARILSLHTAKNLNLGEHLEFGKQLGEVFKNTPKKIALIASANLSHRLKKISPAGYSPKGAKFDNKVIEILNDDKEVAERLLKIDAHLIKEASECGLKPITVILGALQGCLFETNILNYQADLGIGYLSADLEIKHYDQAAGTRISS